MTARRRPPRTTPGSDRPQGGGGLLSVVATPIGNLGDLTFRALETLRAADTVFAEDTRRTRVLLGHHGLAPRVVSAHAHNEERRAAELLAYLEAGQRVALVTDAGTPGVADPGGRLVAAVRAAGFRIEAVPGPSSVAAAISISGLPGDAFSFAGFLPAKPGARRRRLEALLARGETVVFFEGPHRIRVSLEALAELAAERPVAACRELTKTFEEVLAGTPAEILASLDAGRERGEWTVVVGPPPRRRRDDGGRGDQ